MGQDIDDVIDAEDDDVIGIVAKAMFCTLGFDVPTSNVDSDVVIVLIVEAEGGFGDGEVRGSETDDGFGELV